MVNIFLASNLWGGWLEDKDDYYWKWIFPDYWKRKIRGVCDAIVSMSICLKNNVFTEACMPIDIGLSYNQKTQSSSMTLKLNANCARFISSITEKQFGTLDLMFIILISYHTSIVVFLRKFYLIKMKMLFDAKSLRS